MAKKARLCLIALANGPDHQRYTANIANHLGHKYQITVITTKRFNRELINNPDVKLFSIFENEATRLELQALKFASFIEFRHVVNSHPADLVHFSCAHPLNLLLTPFLAQSRKIFTIHDVIPHPEENISLAIQGYNQIVNRVSDHIIVHSKHAYQQLGAYAYKADVVPLGVYDLSPQSRVEPSRTALFFGRIRPYKGLDLFIGAAEIVLNTIPDAHFMIAGNGNLSSYLPLIRRHENFTIINRFIADQEADMLFAKCNFVVLPYRSATQSGIVPVAYANNRPVIATKVGALPEVVIDRETGYLVCPNNTSIANAICELLKDPAEARRMGQAGRKFFEENFTPVKMVDSLERIYQRLVQNVDKKSG